MKMKYGYEIEDWDLAKAEVKDLLIQRAKLRGMMPYSELTTKVRTIELEPNSQALAAMLGQVSEEEDEAGPQPQRHPQVLDRRTEESSWSLGDDESLLRWAPRHSPQ